MLLWGIHQDSTSDLPFTDIDYSVFNDGSNLLIHGCPLEKVLNSKYEDWSDLANPPELNCAKGFLPVIARFTLQNDPLTKVQREERDGEKSMSMLDKESVEYQWTLFCYNLIRPIFNSLASLGDPFQRNTFRYTPLLSVLLSPSQFSWFPIHPDIFGKLVFIASDLGIAVLMWDLLEGRRNFGEKQGWNDDLVGYIWLLNPIVSGISTRGSCESLIGILVLGFLAMFLRWNPEVPLHLINSSKEEQKEDSEYPSFPLSQSSEPLSNWSLSNLFAPLLLALAVHFKLYPIIYSIPIISHLKVTAGINSDGKLNGLNKHLGWIRFGIIAALFYGIINFGVFLL